MPIAIKVLSIFVVLGGLWIWYEIPTVTARYNEYQARHRQAKTDESEDVIYPSMIQYILTENEQYLPDDSKKSPDERTADIVDSVLNKDE